MNYSYPNKQYTFSRFTNYKYDLLLPFHLTHYFCIYMFLPFLIWVILCSMYQSSPNGIINILCSSEFSYFYFICLLFLNTFLSFPSHLIKLDFFFLIKISSVLLWNSNPIYALLLYIFFASHLRTNSAYFRY